MVRNIDQLMANLESRDQLVLDVRSPGRFKGTEPEPRASLRGGRIPESVNVPIPMIMDPKRRVLLFAHQRKSRATSIQRA